MGGVTELTASADDLFARRVRRLAEVTDQLIGAQRAYTQAVITQVQQKAAIYEAHMHVSHGERQGIAAAQTSQIASEVLQLKGQIDVLTEERDFLRFCVQYVEAS